jgi:hypothetical protein
VKDERTPAENLAKALTCGLRPAMTNPIFVEALIAVAYLSNKRVSTLAGWELNNSDFSDHDGLVKYVNRRLEEYKLQVPSSGASFLCVLRGPAKRLF